MRNHVFLSSSHVAVAERGVSIRVYDLNTKGLVTEESGNVEAFAMF